MITVEEFVFFNVFNKWHLHIKSNRKVTQYNLDGSYFYGTEFDTRPLADEYETKALAKKNPFGRKLNARTLLKSQATAYDLTLITEEFEKVIEESYERPLYQTDVDGQIVTEQYEYIDEITGEALVGSQPIPTGEFETIPEVTETWIKTKKDYTVTITDITEETNIKLAKEARQSNGKLVRSICDSILNAIIGFNMEGEKTSEEINAMKITFADILALLQVFQPFQAKPLIEAIVVDEIVTQEMKDEILSFYSL